MLTIRYEKSFKKELKLMAKRGHNLDKIKVVIEMLANQQMLPPKYKDHMLKGQYANFHECHIEPDWLLIYQIRENELLLILTHTGTHSDLF